MTGTTFPRKDAVCTKCGKSKRPTRAHLAILKSADLPYVCQECREKEPVPPMHLGKLGVC